MEKKMVSVIVPIHNAEKFLEECLKSICEQTYSYLEIILIDDGSNDLSEEICIRYQHSDFRIKLIKHDECQGVSKSRNDGLIIAQGEYISFVDADDVLDKDFIKTMIDKIEDNDIAITGYKKFSVGYEKEYVLDKKQGDTWENIMFHVLCTNKIGGYCFNKLYRSEIAKKISFDTSLAMGEDFLFLIEYLSKCKNYVYVSASMYEYRINPNSVTRATEQIKRLDEKRVSYIYAVEKLDKFIKAETPKYQSYASYRVVRGNIWVMLQLIYCNTYNTDLVKRIKKTVSKHYLKYRTIKYGSVFQKFTVVMVMILPQVLFLGGRLMYRCFPKIFNRCVTE